MTLQETIQRVSKSLVFLSVDHGNEGPGAGGFGSGFVVGAAGEIVTAAHLLRDATKVEARVLGSSRVSACSIIATDVAHDVALLKADARDLLPMALWRGESVPVGREVGFMGFPHADIFQPPLVMTMRGIVGNRYRLGETECYVVDANASEGMSGGPVFLAQSGEAIGLVGGRFDPGRTRARLRGSAPSAIRDLPAERANIMFAPAIEYVLALLKKK